MVIKETRVFLDDEHNVVDPKDATIAIVAKWDTETGELIKETFYYKVKKPEEKK